MCEMEKCQWPLYLDISGSILVLLLAQNLTFRVLMYHRTFPAPEKLSVYWERWRNLFQ
jgi:hypothetical protein